MITWACLQVFSSLCCIFVLKRNDPPDGDGSTSVTQKTTDETIETNDAVGSSQDNEKTHLTRKRLNTTSPNQKEDFNPGGETFERIHGWQMIKLVDFWLLMISFIIGTAINRIVASNIGTYLRSFKEEQHLHIITTTNQWGLIAIKIFVGIISDLYAETVPRLTFVLLTTIVNVPVFFVFIFLGDKIVTLYVISYISAISIGIFFLIGPILIAEYFGVKYFAINYGAAFLVEGCFTLLLQFILGMLYDANVSDVATHTCYGLHCYYVSSGILCALSIVTLIATVTLYIRRQKILLC